MYLHVEMLFIDCAQLFLNLSASSSADGKVGDVLYNYSVMPSYCYRCIITSLHYSNQNSCHLIRGCPTCRSSTYCDITSSVTVT